MTTLPQAYTLTELSQRLGIPKPALLVQIAIGNIAVSEPKRFSNHAVVSRDAAIEWCVNVGIDVRRLTR